MQYSQASEVRLPEDVLRKFVADLRHPVAIIEVSLNNLSNRPALESEKEIFTQLGEATQSINENIRSVLDYLHLKLKDGVVETEGKVALEILGHFSHALREYSAPLMGFVSVGQQVNLS